MRKASREEWGSVQSAWRAEQDARDTPTIDQTVIAQTPSGRPVEANRFDYNLAYCNDSYVQLTDASWIKARALQLRASAPARATVAKVA